jgi:prephenate dehydratase
MVYFFKFTSNMKGIVSSTEPLTGLNTITKNIGGVEVKVREQSNASGNVKFGFTAIDPEMAAQMQLKVGDPIDLEITEKNVTDKQGNVVPNLYWAH